MKKLTIFLIIMMLVLVSCDQFQKKKPSTRTLSFTESSNMQEIAEELDYTYQEEQARLSHQDRPQTQITTPPPANTQAQTQQTRTQPQVRQFSQPEHGAFTVQFMALRDRRRIDEVRRILNGAAYFTEVVTVEVNGETFYRLRLVGSFSRNYAIYMGEKIKSEIAEISEYWVTRR